VNSFKHQRHAPLPILLAVAIALLATVVSIQPPSAEAQAIDAPRYLILLDLSGSMDEVADENTGETRLDAAKEALTSALADLPPGSVDIGLRTFDGCAGTSLVAPVAPVDPAALAALIDGLSSGGRTDITTALIEGANDFPDAGDNRILLVSDGADTCGQDPCAAAATLTAFGVQVIIDTVGFQTAGTAAQDQLDCIANASGGTNVTVDTGDELFVVISDIVETLPDPGAICALTGESIDVDGSPCADADGDGICDSWETAGFVSWKGQQIALPGADPTRPSLFLEIDYLEGTQPANSVIALVEGAFASNGYDLNIVVDEAFPFTDIGYGFSGADDVADVANDWFGTADERAAGVTELKERIYRYGMYTNTVYDPSGFAGAAGWAARSGSTFIIGNDILETLGISIAGLDPVNSLVRARVLMHEFGHNLGLQHGGNDEVNWKPNYQSVMNYAYTLKNFTGGLDYSTGTLDTLHESFLLENSGLGPDARDGLWRPFVYNRNTEASDASGNIPNDLLDIVTNDVDQTGPIDWNGDGDITDLTSVSAYLVSGFRGNENIASPAVLNGHDDWAVVEIRPPCGFAFGIGAAALPEPELGAEFFINGPTATEIVNQGAPLPAVTPVAAPAPPPLEYEAFTVAPPEQSAPFGFGSGPDPQPASVVPAASANQQAATAQPKPAVGTSEPATSILAISGYNSRTGTFLFGTAFILLGLGAYAVQCAHSIRRRNESDTTAP